MSDKIDRIEEALARQQQMQKEYLFAAANLVAAIKETGKLMPRYSRDRETEEKRTELTSAVLALITKRRMSLGQIAKQLDVPKYQIQRIVGRLVKTKQARIGIGGRGFFAVS